VINGTRIRWARRVERIGIIKNVYKVLIRKPELKRPLGKPSCRWGFNTRFDVKEIGWENIKLGSAGSG
jgi:hypothetical protein